MPLTFEPEALPIRLDESGAVRVGKTRVRLVSVVYAYLQGESAEGIIEMFDTLDLADVYATIAYYLRHKAEVDEFMAEYEREGDRIQQEIEQRQGSRAGMRERLLRRLELKRAEEAASQVNGKHPNQTQSILK